MPARHVWTIGHGTSSPEDLLQRLAAGEIESLVDIRTAPGSRRHPHLARDELARWVPDGGVRYRWEPRLGGFRRPAPDSPDVALRNSSFRGYAGHLRTAEAHAALQDVLVDLAEARTALMCSETVWWRCHRRLVADALTLLHGVDVVHLLPGRASPHGVTDGVRVAGDDLVYDAVQAPPDALVPDPAR